jgi:hypothetical protein
MKNNWSNLNAESAYEYASLGSGCGGFLVSDVSIFTRRNLRMMPISGGAIGGQIAPMSTTSTRLTPLAVRLLEQSGNRLHKVKGANCHV